MGITICLGTIVLWAPPIFLSSQSHPHASSSSTQNVAYLLILDNTSKNVLNVAHNMYFDSFKTLCILRQFME